MKVAILARKWPFRTEIKINLLISPVFFYARWLKCAYGKYDLSEYVSLDTKIGINETRFYWFMINCYPLWLIYHLSLIICKIMTSKNLVGNRVFPCPNNTLQKISLQQKWPFFIRRYALWFIFRLSLIICKIMKNAYFIKNKCK